LGIFHENEKLLKLDYQVDILIPSLSMVSLEAFNSMHKISHKAPPEALITFAKGQGHRSKPKLKKTNKKSSQKDPFHEMGNINGNLFDEISKKLMDAEKSSITVRSMAELKAKGNEEEEAFVVDEEDDDEDKVNKEFYDSDKGKDKEDVEIIIEVDGHTHFENYLDRRLGPTLMRNRYYSILLYK
jgi:hypothetical protein